MSNSEKATKSFHEWQAAKAAVKDQSKTLREALSNDSTVEELTETAKLAREALKAEVDQFKAKNEKAYEKLSELKDAEADAKLAFDALAIGCLIEGTQLSLFEDLGVEVDFTTKVKVPKQAKKSKDAEPSDDE